MSLLSSELLKLRTTRVPFVLLALIMLVSAVAAVALVGSGALGNDADPALSLAQGASFSGVLALVLGILILTNEYRHGTVNSTYLVEPNRLRVLAAKLAASVLAGGAIAVGAAAAALAVAIPWLAARGESLPLDGALAEASVRLVAVYALNCALGVGVGALLQNQVGAIVASLMWFFIGETVITLVAGLLSDGVGQADPVSRYLPGSALQGILGFSQGGGADEFLLAPAAAALVASAYVVALVALGAVSVTRRDP